MCVFHSASAYLIAQSLENTYSVLARLREKAVGTEVQYIRSRFVFHLEMEMLERKMLRIQVTVSVVSRLQY